MKKMLKYYSLMLLMTHMQYAEAQVGRDRAEKTGTRVEIQVSKHQLNRDGKELEAFKVRILEYKLAYLQMDEEELSLLSKEILKEMDREISQSRSKLSSGSREVRRSDREVKNSDADLRDSEEDLSRRKKGRVGNLLNLRDDRMDHRDEIRDLADDQNDLQERKNIVTKQEELRDKFMSFSFIQDDIKDIEKVAEVRLLNQFLQTMQEDITATKIELSEDRRELREDRKELWEDRRERREERRERRAMRYI